MDSVDQPSPASETDTLPVQSLETSRTLESTPIEQATVQSQAPGPASMSEEVEDAYWASYQEDTSSPNEEELKAFQHTESDYSARDHTYWENNFFRDLEDPEYTPKDKVRLTWKFKGVRGTPDAPNRETVIRSPAAYVGGYWWRIKFYPRGNNVGSLSVYVECSTTLPEPDEKIPECEFTVRRGTPEANLNDKTPDTDFRTAATTDSAAWMETFKSLYPRAASASRCTEETTSSSWRVAAQIGVIVYNPDEPRTGWMQSSCHQFNPHNLDWGWTYFHGPWDAIHCRRRGQHRALLNNDTLAFDTYIRVVDDPTKSLWWHPSDSEPTWDSLALTGYRPIGDSVINHSAEVAGLASWLHIAPFCKIIQSVNVLEHLTNCDIKPKPLCDALQKLLWRLRCRTQSLHYVDTDGITSTLRNLGEYSSDVIEFWERVRRTLELELAGTEAGEAFGKLFDSPSPHSVAGSGDAQTIKTLPTDFNSRIRVQASEVKSTREAVRGYLSDHEGLWSLPPVLHVELGRQTLDKALRLQLQFNKVELDDELDLTPFVADTEGSKYILYGYVVHRGRRTSGKFFSILRPAGPGTRWLAFDDGSDNRVECLTQKTAMSLHIGLDESQTPDHKKGHDIPVVAMYVRSDMVSELLPGPQGPWEVPESLKEYYETGKFTQTPEEDLTVHKDVQVEVYSVAKHDEMNSLFDTYDLMAQAKLTNSVMYMSVPGSCRIAELRKKISLGKSTGDEKIGPERVRLWRIGQTHAQCGPTLAFDPVGDLNDTLDQSQGFSRFWMEIISEDDAQFFAIPDPPSAILADDKVEDPIVERVSSETPEPVPAEADGDAVASSSVAHDVSLPPAVTSAPEIDAFSEERAEHDAVLAVVAALGQETPSTPPVEASADTPTVQPTIEAPTQPEITLPVGHAYYFVQIFDADKQVLRTVGSFFSKLEENVKASVRKHLKRPMLPDFLMWQRVDGISITAVSPAESFGDVRLAHGSCIIIGDKMNNARRYKLGTSGLFSSPDRLVQYLWASSRRHPIRGFTGHKTVEANFTCDYYKGDFLKGHYHGQGKHISGTGTLYDGNFVFGRRHGAGKMNYPGGDVYDGDWVDDVRHGQGSFTDSTTGNKYVGGFKDGKRHGKGITYWEVAEDEADLCQICFSEEQDAVIADCGHVCSCVGCAKQVDLCPICRKKITNVIKMYRT
ncbi:Zinc finger RING-type [Penicillium taxi]|uniref:Zinc finger RING-type n=1 Tax=Penicillium taxi TaxID=168475 RepID=UPI0025451709|nr:Zinc finger RING-type [Penicillium taxi]KAJ5908712.1 Zinc finger RING-type [Penicillium taxi]